MATTYIKNDNQHYPLARNSEHLTHPKYRADIDGLRAIAVLSVVGFHAFPSWVKGGFIGVDIFFVISGFLISTIIFGRLERNSFNFVEFYSRRIKRIFPALLLVLTASYAFGWFALLADEYKQLGKHIAGGAGFVSNYLFWNESGYFDNAAETKPLLHLWSLGIEEQFYFIWPLLLWLAWRAQKPSAAFFGEHIAWKKRLNLLTIAIAVGVISFALSIGKVRSDAVAAFYSPQTRFWELMVGSVLAYMTQHKQNLFPKFKHRLDTWLGQIVYAQAPEANGKTLHSVQSVFGVALITIGVLVITKERHFPGWWAVLPTAGAVLIISAGSQAWLNRTVLSSRVLVWFGLISYPLYLWHWPLLSFARIVESETPAGEIRTAAVLISIVLAWLTYKLIEKPIRFGYHSKTKTITLLILMIVVGCVGYNCYKHDGLIFRPNAQPQVKNTGDIGPDEFFKYLNQNFYLCTPINIQKQALTYKNSIRCYQSEKSEYKKIAIIGDSHAEHLFIGLAEELIGINIVFYIKNSSPNIYNKEFEIIFNNVINDNNITAVILSAYWNVRLGQTPIGSNFKNELVKTVSKLTAANKKVYIADDVPNFLFDPQKCKFQRSFARKNICIEDSKYFYSQYQNYYPILQSIEETNPSVKILKTAEYFCSEGLCSMANSGKLFYRDDNHLNINGSKYLGKKIIENNPQIRFN